MRGLLIFIGVLLYRQASGYKYLRLTGSLPSFNDNPQEYPADDQIRNVDAPDLVGETVTLGFSFNAWGYSFTSVKIFDTGYILLDSTKSYEEFNGVLNRANYPYIAPLWMQSTFTAPPNSYRVAWSIIDQTQPERAYVRDRIRNEINKGLHLYPTTGEVTNALVVTWKIGDLNGDYNKFQVVLAKVNVGGTVKDYVFFYYDSVLIPPAFPSANINGNYAANAQPKFARACESTSYSILPQYSNYKCSDAGFYLFDMEAGTECSTNTADLCLEDYGRPNCMTPFVVPQDTCTESAYCILNDAGTVLTVSLWMKYYAFSSLTALNYDVFIGSGTVADPVGGQQFITTCQKHNLANAGGLNAEDTFTFDVTLDPLDNPLPCGINLDQIEGTISYAFAIYDPLNPETDLDGKFIFYGDLNCKDLPRRITQTPMFNDNEVTDIVRTPRELYIKWIDRPDANTHLELTSVKVGRDVYSLVCFHPGTPYNLNADPFGAKPVDCSISNNIDFNNNPTSGTGDPQDRAVQVFQNGCVIRSSTQSYHFTREYLLDLQFDVKGGKWCLVSGKMDAAPFNSAEKSIWMRCTIEFCTNSNDATCDDSCQTNRRKRSVSANNTASGTETLTIKLDIEPDENQTTEKQTTEEKVTSSETDDCVDMTTAITVLAILVGVTLLVFAVSLLIGFKLLNLRKHGRKQ